MTKWAGYASNRGQSYEKNLNQCILKLEEDDYVELGAWSWNVYSHASAYHTRLVIFYIG